MNKSPSLSKYEIACVTAGVPATGDPVLDQIITQGLRFKTAAEIVAHNPCDIESAIRWADELIDAFRKPKSSDDK